MSDINVVTLSGRVGQDPEEGDGIDVTNFSLAVDNYMGQDNPSETTWVKCALWGTRRKVAEYIRSGMKIMVTGRLRIKKVEGTDGNKYYTSVNVDSVVLPDRDGETSSASNSSSTSTRRSRTSSGGSSSSSARGRKRPSF